MEWLQVHSNAAIEHQQLPAKPVESVSVDDLESAVLPLNDTTGLAQDASSPPKSLHLHNCVRVAADRPLWCSACSTFVCCLTEVPFVCLSCGDVYHSTCFEGGRVPCIMSQKNCTVEDVVEVQGHTWRPKYCSKPTKCGICKEFIWGVKFEQQEAMKCSSCKITGHRKCCLSTGQCEPIDRDTFDSSMSASSISTLTTNSSVEFLENTAPRSSDQRRSLLSSARTKISMMRVFEGKKAPESSGVDSMKVDNAKSSGGVSTTTDNAESSGVDTMKTDNADSSSTATSVESHVENSSTANGHAWRAKYCSKPTNCGFCKEFIWGLTKEQQNALKCNHCQVTGHRKCCLAAPLWCSHSDGVKL